MGYSQPGTFPSSSLSAPKGFLGFVEFWLTKEAELLNSAETFLAEQSGDARGLLQSWLQAGRWDLWVVTGAADECLKEGLPH